MKIAQLIKTGTLDISMTMDIILVRKHKLCGFECIRSKSAWSRCTGVEPESETSDVRFSNWS